MFRPKGTCQLDCHNIGVNTHLQDVAPAHLHWQMAAVQKVAPNAFDLLLLQAPTEVVTTEVDEVASGFNQVFYSCDLSQSLSAPGVAEGLKKSTPGTKEEPRGAENLRVIRQSQA